jgi:hypothetical protein
MRTAIENNLADFYRNEINIEDDISEEKYTSIIATTVDPDTGDSVTSFTLTSPSGDITTAAGELATIGVITFP